MQPVCRISDFAFYSLNINNGYDINTAWFIFLPIADNGESIASK